MATRAPERARKLFTGSVSWSQQHQVGFVLREGRLPTLTRRHVVDVLAARNSTLSALGLPDEVLALVLPAVDGDFVEVVARDHAIEQAMHLAISDECERHGVPFGTRPPRS